VQPSTAALVREVVEAIPRATFWRRFGAGVTPRPRQESSLRCPSCGRSLPRFSVTGIAMGAGFGMAMPRTKQELVHECLVDGHRARHARSMSAADLTAAGNEITDGLRAAGWDAWASLVARAGDSSSASIEQTFQELEALRRFGPLTRVDALETLIASSGRYWEPHPTTSG